MNTGVERDAHPSHPTGAPRLLRAVVWVCLCVGAASCGDDGAVASGGDVPGADAGVDVGAGADAGADTGDDADLDSGTNSAPCAPALGLYASADCATLSEGAMAFAPQYPLWSDGVSKARFVYLPPGATIDVSDPDGWVFPVGTTFWKHFQTPDGVRLETRILKKTADLKGDDGWVFETYVWNAQGDDVTQVTDGMRDVLGTDHDIPAVDDCGDCHSGGQNQRGVTLGQGDLLDLALGFGAIQLNHNASATTLDSLAAAGWLSGSVSTADAVVPGDAIAQAALGYLHANCGSCHGGASPAKDLTMSVPVGAARVEDTPTYQGNVNQATDPNERATGLDAMPETRIVPGDPESSALLWRMQQRSDDDENDAPMPPLATEAVDSAGVSAVEAWIESL